MIYNFYFIDPRHPLHILVPGERLVFLGFLYGVMHIHTYKKYVYLSSTRSISGWLWLV